MKAVLQRVGWAEVCVLHVDGTELERARIGEGLVVLLGVMRGDVEAASDELAERVARYRVFEDEEGRMNRSALDLAHEVLVVSQFTLAADGRSGRRPSFDRAEKPARAQSLYERFVARLRELGLRTATGRFGARMEVRLANRGPATFVLDTERPGGAPRG